MKKLIGLSVAIAFAATGCGSGASVEAFCTEYDAFETLTEDDTSFESGDPAIIEEYFDKAQQGFKDVADASPDEIKDDSDTLVDAFAPVVDGLKAVDYDITALDPEVFENEAADEASDRVDAFYLENCEGTTSE